MFTEGEDMYVQGQWPRHAVKTPSYALWFPLCDNAAAPAGSTVWHPDCRDGSRAEDGFVVR